MFESTISFLKKYENRKNIEKDFEWVIKVLSSSTNFNHIGISNKIFIIFLHKWRNVISEKEKEEYIFVFEQEKLISIGQFL